jgi:iron-sulfur cluster assembly accessory protein
LTEVAAAKLREILEKQGKTDHYVRVQVVKGGCAGYTYNMDFAKEMQSGDIIVSSNGTAVLVDGDSYDMLKGVTIDYVETLQGAGFKFNNPGAKATCGCGKSYHYS